MWKCTLPQSVERFGGLVNLNVHFHLLVPDGVFAQTGTELAFMLLPAPTGGDLLAILDRVMRRVARRLDREAPDDPALADAPPELFAHLQAEAATTWRSPATARRRVRGSDRLRAWCDGFSLHAGVVVPDYDREALEHLCRYGARPAFALERLAWTADGRISYQLKRPWPDRHGRVCPHAVLRCGSLRFVPLIHAATHAPASLLPRPVQSRRRGKAACLS